jgi:hypothetical protein
MSSKAPYVYGFCPQCGGEGLWRERRPNGDDGCVNGHVYPSKEAVMNKFISFQGIKEVKVPVYEVIDAETENDTFVSVFRVPARGVDGKNWATDVEDAACQWAEEKFSDYDYPREMHAIVTDPQGIRWKVDIQIESVPSFSGTAKRIDP